MRILFDTDFLINLFVPNEPNNLEAQKIMKIIVNYEGFVLNLVWYEMATVLSRKYNHSFALKILEDFRRAEYSIIRISQEEENSVWKEFFSHKKKNISFIDCANLTMAKDHGFKIASFDKFYPQEMLV